MNDLLEKFSNTLTVNNFNDFAIMVAAKAMQQRKEHGVEGLLQCKQELIGIFISNAFLTQEDVDKIIIHKDEKQLTPTQWTDRAIDDILKLLEEVRKKLLDKEQLQFKDPEWKEGFKEGMAVLDAKQQESGETTELVNTFEQKLKKWRVSQATVHAFAQVAVTWAASDPTDIPPATDFLLFSGEHPLTSPLEALQELSPLTKYYATLPDSSPIHQQMAELQEKQAEIFAQNHYPLPNQDIQTNLAVASLFQLHSRYSNTHAVIIANIPTNAETTSQPNLDRPTLEKVAAALADGDDQKAIDIASTQIPEREAEKMVEQTRYEIETQSLQKNIQEENITQPVPYPAAYVTATEIIKFAVPDATAEEITKWSQATATSITQGKTDASEITSELSFNGVPANAALEIGKKAAVAATVVTQSTDPSIVAAAVVGTLAGATKQSVNSFTQDAAYSSKSSDDLVANFFAKIPNQKNIPNTHFYTPPASEIATPLEHVIDTLGAPFVAAGIAVNSKQLTQAAKSILSGNSTIEVQEELKTATTNKQVSPTLAAGVNKAVEIASYNWAPPTTKAANVVISQLQNITDPKSLADTKVKTAFIETAQLIREQKPIEIIEKQIAERLVPTINKTATRPVDSNAFTSTLNNYAATWSPASSTQTGQSQTVTALTNPFIAAGVAAEVINGNKQIAQSFVEAGKMIQNNKPIQEIQQYIEKTTIPLIQTVTNTPLPASVAAAVNTAVSTASVLSNQTLGGAVAQNLQNTLSVSNPDVSSNSKVQTVINQIAQEKNPNQIDYQIKNDLIPAIQAESKSPVTPNTYTVTTNNITNLWTAPTITKNESAPIAATLTNPFIAAGVSAAVIANNKEISQGFVEAGKMVSAGKIAEAKEYINTAVAHLVEESHGKPLPSNIPAAVNNTVETISSTLAATQASTTAIANTLTSTISIANPSVIADKNVITAISKTAEQIAKHNPTSDTLIKAVEAAAKEPVITNTYSAAITNLGQLSSTRQPTSQFDSEVSSSALKTARRQVEIVLTANGVNANVINNERIKPKLEELAQMVQKGTSTRLLRESVNNDLLPEIAKIRGGLPFEPDVAQAVYHALSEKKSSTLVDQIENNLSVAGATQAFFSTPSVANTLEQLASESDPITAKQIIGNLSTTLQSQNISIPSTAIESMYSAVDNTLLTPPLSASAPATAAAIVAKTVSNLTADQSAIFDKQVLTAKDAATLADSLTSAGLPRPLAESTAQNYFTNLSQIASAPQNIEPILIATKSLPANFDQQTSQQIAQIIASSPTKEAAIEKISALPAIKNAATTTTSAYSIATNIDTDVRANLEKGVISSPQTITQLTEITHAAKKLPPEQQVAYIQKQLMAVLPISEATAAPLAQKLATTQTTATKSQISVLLTQKNELTSSTKLIQDLSQLDEKGTDPKIYIQTILTNRLGTDPALTKILQNQEDIAAIMANISNKNDRQAVLRDTFISLGANPQNLAQLSSKDYDAIAKAFIQTLPASVRGQSISNPELAVSLLKGYTFASEDVKKATQKIFQNKQTYDAALTYVLGPKIAQEFNKQQLTETIVILSKFALEQERSLGIAVPADHVSSSVNMALQYLKATNPNLAPAIAQLQKNLPANMEIFRNLLEAGHYSYINNLGDPNQILKTFQSSNFIKYITVTNPTDANGQVNITTTLNAQNPNFKSILERILTPKQFAAFQNLMNQVNQIAPYVQVAMNPVGYAKSRVQSAVLNRLAQTKAGQAVGAAVNKVNQAIGNALAKVGLGAGTKALGTQVGAAIGSAIPIPGLGTLIGAVIGWVVSSVVGKTVGKIAHFTKEHAPVILAGAATVAGGAVTGSVLVGLGAGVVTFATSTFIIGGSAAVASTSATIGATFAALITATATAIGTPLLIMTFVLPIALAFFLVIINNSSYVLPTSSIVLTSGGIGTGGVGGFDGNDTIFTNISGCPLANPAAYRVPSYNPTAEASIPRTGGTLNRTGHGSSQYWTTLGGACSYNLPQWTSCRGPNNPNNVCNLGNNGCPFYGYALDIFPPVRGTLAPVFLPTMDGQILQWKYDDFQGSNGSDGFSFRYVDTTGKYRILFTHVQNNAIKDPSRIMPSGQQVASLYNQGGNTHLHIELQIDNQYVKPEQYLCGN